MSSQSYEVAMFYPVEPISLLDRNILRIAKNYGGSVRGDSFEYGADRRCYRLAYSFETKAKRRRFIAAVRKFLETSDFGVEVTVE